jgi:lysophospholipase L1-like esterase
VAVYRAFGRAAVRYRVCVRKRGGRKRCDDRRTHHPGQRSRTRIHVHGSGRYQVAWFEDGKAVDRDKLVVRERAAFIVGDSLSEGTKPYLPGALSGWKVDQSVATSRHVPEGIAILRRRSSLPGAVIFALGTNDDPHAVGAFANSLEEVLRIAGDTRCVVVPNIVRPPVGGASYAGYNQAIAGLARRHENFREVDWAKLVAHHRGWLASDGSHVTAEGYQARARAIADQVERC